LTYYENLTVIRSSLLLV
jgi:hypothetical protein